MSKEAVNITITGRVQGVGFRPFVYQLATNKAIVGTVQNNMDGVCIYAQGLADDVQAFVEALVTEAPPAAVVHHIEMRAAQVDGKQTTFSIIPSDDRGVSQLVIPPDLAVCATCAAEMSDEKKRRYRYPFINCTQCGPRYTTIGALPYDRLHTSMEKFTMCDLCRREYENVQSRYYHAQPIACASCGPTVTLMKSNGQLVNVVDPLLETIRLLKEGKIVAMKGIGGYHLCCDATNEVAISQLRNRKNRPHRPLAVMVSTINEIENICVMNEKEQDLLESKEAPIVILKKRPHSHMAKNIAPSMETIGVILAYTPLHHLLLEDQQLRAIVFTSANLSGQPLLYEDSEAVSQMNGVADYILAHNREILHPIDDSVVQVNAGVIDVQRRARGFGPEPLATKKNVTHIVAFGGQQKATCALGSNGQVFVSPHIGDMENIETIDHYTKTLEHLLKWIPMNKEIAVIDAHPSYHVRHVLKEYQFEKVVEVQHHHAHMVACMEENALTDKAWGVILDGTGYGEDGNIWGFEILYGDAISYERIAHLRYTPLPGGDKAITEPWRNAVAMLIHLLKDEGVALSHQLFPHKEKEIEMITMMLNKQINTVFAGTCGRLFDAISAMCDVCRHSTYDGEAAVTLSELAVQSDQLKPYNFIVIDGAPTTIDFTAMVKEIALDVLAEVDVVTISSRFHETIAQAICEALIMSKRDNAQSTNKVVFSGGSFHNRFLRERLGNLLTEQGFQVYNHKRIPCNDGGISYGQLFIAAAKRKAVTL